MEDSDLETRLAELQQEHRDLDHAIHALQDQGVSDQLRVQRLKKKKLHLRDQIAAVANMMVPDIIA